MSTRSCWNNRLARHGCGTISRKQRGASALIVAMIISGLMLVMCAATMTVVQLNSGFSQRAIAYSNALAIAEAGAERAFAELNTSSSPWIGWGSNGSDYSKTETLRDHDRRELGFFVVTVSDYNSSTPLIRSEGCSSSRHGPAIRRTVNVTARSNFRRSPVGEFGIFSAQNVIMAAGVTIDSYDSTLGAYGVNGNRSMNASVAAANNVLMAALVNVGGNVQAGGQIVQLLGATVTGTASANNAPTWPPEFPATDMEAARYNNNNSAIKRYRANPLGQYVLVDNPLANGSTALSAGLLERIVIPPGNYYLSGLNLGISSEIRVDPPGKVNLYVDGRTVLEANTKINANTANPRNFSMFSNGLINAEGVAFEMHGALYAPGASLTGLAAGVRYYGALVVGTIGFSGAAQIHQDISVGGPILTQRSVLPNNWIEVKSRTAG